MNWDRRCWICDKTGLCKHREIEVENAILEAMLRRMRELAELKDAA